MKKLFYCFLKRSSKDMGNPESALSQLLFRQNFSLQVSMCVYVTEWGENERTKDLYLKIKPPQFMEVARKVP
jgi:hypothetical protein